MRMAALMLTGEAFYAGRAHAAHETWLREFDAFQIHSFAPCAFLPVTRSGTREGWRSCFDKRHDGLKAAAKMECDWFCCCSCDNYFFVKTLRRELPIIDEPILFGGGQFEEAIRNGEIIRYPPGGAGYCLNRLALLLLVANLNCLREEWRKCSGWYEAEDVFNGWACSKLGIRYIQHPGFHQGNPFAAHAAMKQVPQVEPERIISYHYVNEAEIRMLHENRD